MLGKDKILSIAILICSIGFLLRSIPNATAFQSPTVSLGSNPVLSWSGRVSSDGWTELGTLTQNFMITDFQVSNTDGLCQMIIATSQSTSQPLIGGSMRSSSGAFQGKFSTGIFVPSGETLYLYIDHYNDYCYYNVSGYYTH